MWKNSVQMLEASKNILFDFSRYSQSKTVSEGVFLKGYKV